MSGPGDSSYGGPSRSASDCNIIEKVPLNSPKASVLKTIHVGDVLTVELQDQTLVAVTKVGAIAGSLTPLSLLDLIDCIGKGRRYVACVTDLQGGLCEVEIRPR
jgi:hypothetical protein